MPDTDPDACPPVVVAPPLPAATVARIMALVHADGSARIAALITPSTATAFAARDARHALTAALADLTLLSAEDEVTRCPLCGSAWEVVIRATVPPVATEEGGA